MRRKMHIYIKCMRLNFTFSCRCRFHEIFLIFVAAAVVQSVFSILSCSALMFCSPFFFILQQFGCNVHYVKRIASVSCRLLFLFLQCTQAHTRTERETYSEQGKSDLVFWLSLMMVLFLSSSSSSLQLVKRAKQKQKPESKR